MNYGYLRCNLTRLHNDRNKFNNGLGTKNWFYPVNVYILYNVIASMIGEKTKPSLRETNYDYNVKIMELAKESYVKVNFIGDEIFKTRKTNPISTNPNATQITHTDVKKLTGKNYGIIIQKISEILSISNNDVLNIAFDALILKIQNLSSSKIDAKLIYNNRKINELIDWCKIKKNKCVAISNDIQNIQLSHKNDNYKKVLFNGCTTVSLYKIEIFVPLKGNIGDKMFKQNWCTILDDGLIEYIDKKELYPIDVMDFTIGAELNNMRRSLSKLDKQFDVSKTIYKDINDINFETELINIITQLNLNFDLNCFEYKDIIKVITNKKIQLNIRVKIFDEFIEKQINKKLDIRNYEN